MLFSMPNHTGAVCAELRRMVWAILSRRLSPSRRGAVMAEPCRHHGSVPLYSGPGRGQSVTDRLARALSSAGVEGGDGVTTSAVTL